MATVEVEMVHYTPDGTPVQGTMMPLGVMAPDVCPDNLRDIDGAVVSRGMYVPWGSVAKTFIDAQHEIDEHRNDRTSHVYFIQSHQGGPIKIGLARDVRLRLAALQTAHPYRLRVIGTIRGGRNVERRVHDSLSQRRMSGEWFDITEAEAEAIINGSD